MYISRSEVKIVEFGLHGIYTALVKDLIHKPHELQNANSAIFRDSAQLLTALIFTLKMGIAQNRGKW